MEISNLFKSQSNSEATPKLFLAIEIHEALVKTAVWQEYKGQVSLVNTGSFEAWENPESLINGVDASLSQAVKKLDIEPRQVIFGLPESWLEKDSIATSKTSLIKKIIKDLDLEPIGLVTTTESIIHQLKVEEGIPPSVVLLEVFPTRVIVSLVHLGKIEKREEVGRSDDLAKDVEEGLTRMETNKLPVRFILTNGSNLENEQQQIVSYPWQDNLNFLHIPKVEVLPADFSIRAIALAGGSEAIKASPEAGQKASQSLRQEIEKGDATAASLGFEIEEADKATSPLDSESPFKLSPKKTISTEDPAFDEVIPEQVDTSPAISSSETTPVKTQTPPPKSSRFSLPSFSLPRLSLPSRPSFKFKLAFLAIPLAFLPFLIFGLYYLFAIAQIDIKITSTQASETVPVIFANKPQGDTFTIPVQFKTVTAQASKQISTTGETTVGDKASGKVSLYNKTLEPITVDANTTLETTNGILFNLSDPATIASTSATVEGETYGKVSDILTTARSIGVAGNVPKDTQFSVANYPKSSLVAVSQDNFSGGSSRTVKAVAKSDIEEIKKLVSQEIVINIDQQVKNDDPDLDTKVIKELEVKSEDFSNLEGEEAAQVSLNSTAQSQIITYSHTFLVNAISKEIISKKYPGMRLLPEQTKVEVSDIKNIEDKQEVLSATISFEGVMIPDLDISNYKSQLAGKSIGAAQQLLSTIQNYSSATIAIRPNLPLLKHILPYQSGRITINIQTN